MIMKTSKTFSGLAAVLAISALTACGGGGGGSAPNPVPAPTQPKPAEPGNPASGSAKDLAAFARTGGAKQMDGYVRYTRAYGSGSSVSYDALPGGAAGLVTLSEAGKARVFDLNGGPMVSADTPSGVYTGDIDLDYRMTAGGDWRAMRGNMAMSLDLEGGKVGIDSIAGNGSNVIEVMGEAQVSNGVIGGEDLTTRVRDAEGRFMFDAKGSVDGLVSGTGDDAGIAATFEGSHANGFGMNGGAVLVLDPEFN